MLIPIRDENPTKRFPIVTVTLFLANVAIFIFMLTLPSVEAVNDFIMRYALYPASIIQGIPLRENSNALQPVYLTLISAMFLHGGFLHIISNMLYLWIFGNNVEDVFGRVRFVLFYIASGIAGSLLQIAIDPNSTIPNLGASGAISGVLAGYLILFPNARVLTIIPIIFIIEIVRIPAIALIGFWFLLQVFSGVFALGGPGGGVAYFAHIGGFLAGLVLTFIFTRRRHKEWY